MASVDEDLRLSSNDSDIESDEFSTSGDEFWYKAGQSSSLTSNTASATIPDRSRFSTEPSSQVVDNGPKSNPSVGKMARLMKKTLKFESDAHSNRPRKPSKYVQIEAVTRRFVEISQDFTSETLKLLKCLHYLCDDDERCVTNFVQNKGLQRLRDVVRRFVTAEFYWTKYQLDPSSGNLHNDIGNECVRLLERLSRFQSTHTYIERMDFAPLVVNLFDPMYTFFAQKIDPNDFEKV